MNVEQLKQKAQPFIRKVQLFVMENDSDERTGYANEDESIRFLGKHLGKWMGLTEEEDEFKFLPVDIESIDLNAYTPLTERTIEVYPPFETLMHYGDEEVQAWIAENDGDKDDVFSLVAFAPEEYTDIWMNSHPIYSSEEIFAYQGGWAMTWPEDDVPMQWNEHLEFLFQIGVREEPFVEVFYDKDKGNYICLERNT